MKAIYPSWIYPSFCRMSLLIELGVQVVGDEGVMMKNVLNDEKEVIQVVVENDVKEMIKVVGLVIIKDCMEGVVMYEEVNVVKERILLQMLQRCWQTCQGIPCGGAELDGVEGCW